MSLLSTNTNTRRRQRRQTPFSATPSSSRPSPRKSSLNHDSDMPLLSTNTNTRRRQRRRRQTPSSAAPSSSRPSPRRSSLNHDSDMSLLSTNTRRRQRRRRQSPSSATPSSSILSKSATPDSQSIANTTTSSSSNSRPRIVVNTVVPLPIFRGVAGECPAAHLANFNHLFPSAHLAHSHFAFTLADDAALWHEITVDPRPSMSWDEIKTAFLRAFHAPDFAVRARTELVSLRQGDEETVTLYHLRMQRILKRWKDHRLPASFVKGLFVDGLRKELQDWVAPKSPETLEEAVEIATDWEGAMVVRREREEWRRKSIGRKSMCRCKKHQCWKKYEMSECASNAAEAEAAEAVGAVSSAERIGAMMMSVGAFFLNLFM